MNNQNQAEVIQRSIDRFKQLHRKAPRIMGTVAVALYKESFAKQGSVMGGGRVQPWKGRGAGPRNRAGRKLLIKTGALQRSIGFNTTSTGAVVTSNMPYSAIQNDGGVIRITPKMRRYFWAMFKSTKDSFWRNMAMHKGNTITIPGRPFIYDTPELVTRLNNTFKPMIEAIFT